MVGACYGESRLEGLATSLAFLRPCMGVMAVACTSHAAHSCGCCKRCSFPQQDGAPLPVVTATAACQVLADMAGSCERGHVGMSKVRCWPLSPGAD